jgi:hypothetical protein
MPMRRALQGEQFGVLLTSGEPAGYARLRLVQ